MDLLSELTKPLRNIEALSIWRAVILVIVGLILARVVASAVSRILARRTSSERVALMRRVAFHVVNTAAIFVALRELGFDLSIFLGAAGVLTVAIGFASQTSASNIISGLFLVGEQPFIVGENIQIGNISGEVISIDSLSVKLRTFDNLYARIPNESLIKSEIINLSRFPIRRFEVKFEVGHHEDLDQIERLIREAIMSTSNCLEEPAAQFHVRGFTSTGVTICMWIWVDRNYLLEVQTELLRRIKLRFNQANIQIPRPQFAMCSSQNCGSSQVVNSGDPVI